MSVEKWGYVWPIDDWGNRKSIKFFSDLEQVRYQLYLARLECTNNNSRNIRNEILYLSNWYNYFAQLSRADEFDPEVLKYFSLEIVRLYKERDAWQ